MGIIRLLFAAARRRFPGFNLQKLMHQYIVGLPVETVPSDPLDDPRSVDDWATAFVNWVASVGLLASTDEEICSMHRRFRAES